jgi:agmatine deiminase
LSIIDQLQRATDDQGDPFELIELPSCGRVLDRFGTIMPASFVNFLIGDNTVVVPTYGTAYDDEAVTILSEHFSKKVVGLDARSILTGGGAFHCISQEFFR